MPAFIELRALCDVCKSRSRTVNIGTDVSLCNVLAKNKLREIGWKVTHENGTDKYTCVSCSICETNEEDK